MTPDRYTVVFDRLRLPARIGCYDHEYQATQPVLISLRLTAQWPAGGMQQVEDTIDHAWILGALKAVIGEQHYDLTEQLGAAIGETLMTDARINEADITILKTDQMKEAEGVGASFLFRKK
mgnify:CR=1 FL=1